MRCRWRWKEAIFSHRNATVTGLRKKDSDRRWKENQRWTGSTANDWTTLLLDCISLLSADLTVHAFLEQWGLINYQVDSENRPAPVVPPTTSHFMVLADTPMGVQPALPPAQLTEDAKRKDDEKKTAADNGEVAKMAAEGDNLGLRTDIYAKQLAAMKTKGATAGREWADQETLMLLEALELYKDDWNKMADHVGRRTQDESIMRFLQLPIQGSLL